MQYLCNAKNYVTMKKLIMIIAALVVFLDVYAQKVYRVERLKSFNMGAAVLERVVQADTTYAIVMKSGGAYVSRFTVALGKKDEAIRLLTFISELKLSKDDVVELENETDNFIKKGPLGGLALCEKVTQRYSVITTGQAKKMLEAVKEDK